ncbi:MAG: NAD(P)H-hydrate epimerase [Planctomycetota bacterium]|jgi:NAD(P)H-hydrate epimerase
MPANSKQSEYMLDRESVRRVDRAAIEEFGIPGIVLMENAALGLTIVTLTALDDISNDEAASVLIVCGSGNNGGDGYALGRHLHNAGVRVTFTALGEPKPGSDAATNRNIALKMGLPEVPADRAGEHFDADLIVDGIFGTGLDRPVRGAAAEVIDRINGSGRPVLAIDVPSGLDCDTGRPLGTAIRATRTVTFVGRKPAMTDPGAREFVGEVSVADIGAPVELLQRFGRPA